jgi:hypothetical protein
MKVRKMDKDFREIVKKTIDESKEDDPKIIKELVVGFLIVKSKVSGGNSYINVVPLNSSWDAFNGDNDLDANEEIVGVIPAPQGSYKVLGLFQCEEDEKDEKDEEDNPCNGIYNTLGYEYKGAYYPDWKNLLEEMIKNGEHVKRRKQKIGIQ